MQRLAVTLALTAAACGTADERPATLEYITAAVLAPNCGNAQCHSSFKVSAGYAFDTVEVARSSIVNAGLVNTDDVEESFLLDVLTRTVDRMPYDQPLPNADIELIRRWIRDGAPGLEDGP
jgi:hypothetical protein